MTQPLFIQPDVHFEKIAAEVDLSEDPNTWPHEVVQELYKQVPYIADFEPHVTMEKVDSERGYGMGHVTLSTKSEAQMGTDPDMLEAAGVRSVRIPVVIKERKLCPFDLLINDSTKTLPLTESRLRQALFRPQAFDVTSQTPGDQSMIGQLYPPYRQNYGFGGGGVSIGAGMGKSASALEDFLLEKSASVHEEQLVRALEAKDAGFRRPTVPFKKTASLLTATFSTFNRADIDGFFHKLAADEGLQAAYSRNHNAIMGPLTLLAHNEPISVEKTAGVLASSLKPSVTQLTKVASGGYIMKTASALYWNPSTVEVDRRDVVRAFGEKVALAADESGQVTLAEGAASAPPAEAPLDQDQAKIIETSGLYKVKDEATGKELIGCVVTNLLDVDGTPMPLALFTNGSHSATQPDIVGTPAGEGINLPVAKVGGAGAFFSHTNDGQLQATIPLELSGGSYAMPGEPATLKGSTFDGREIEVSVQPNIQTVMLSPEGKVLVPDSWQWTPLGASESVSLVGNESSEESPEDWHESSDRETPEDFGDGAEPVGEESDSEESKESHVVVRGDHDCFSFTGPAVAKLASTETQMVSLDQAMFLLGGLGVHQGYGVEKLAHSFNGPQRIDTHRAIITAAEQDAWARRQAEKCAHIAPLLRKDLMKEASAIPDPSSVDAVLSLGFINPENIMSFVSYLPTLEEAQSKMCELLLASRLGISDVPSSALERAVRSTEEAIEGLKVLAFQGS